MKEIKRSNKNHNKTKQQLSLNNKTKKCKGYSKHLELPRAHSTENTQNSNSNHHKEYRLYHRLSRKRTTFTDQVQKLAARTQSKDRLEKEKELVKQENYLCNE